MKEGLDNYYDLEKSDLSSLDFELSISKFKLIDDFELLELGLEFINDTSKPIYFESRSLDITMESEELNKTENLSEFPRSNINRDFFIKDGDSVLFNEIKAHSQSNWYPIYFFYPNLEDYFFKDTEPVIEKSIENENYNIEVILKDISENSTIDIAKNIIDRETIVDQIGNIKDIEDYDDVMFLEKI